MTSETAHTFSLCVCVCVFAQQGFSCCSPADWSVRAGLSYHGNCHILRSPHPMPPTTHTHTRTSYLILFSLWLSPFCRSTYFLLSPLHLFWTWLLLPYLYRTKWELNSSNECQSFVFFLQCREAAISKPLKYNIKCVDKLFQNLGRASVELTLNKF